MEELNRSFGSAPRDSLREGSTRTFLSSELIDRLAELGLLVPLSALIRDVEKCTEEHDRDAWAWAVRVSSIQIAQMFLSHIICFD